jgi:hypothetical protein
VGKDRGKELAVDRREGSIERLLHRIEEYIDESHDRRRAREEELDSHREMMWAEAAEREELLVQNASDEEAQERSLEEVAKEHRVAFVVHSEAVGKALKEFAGRQVRLINVVPGSGQKGAEIKGSWLVFE